MYFFVFYPIYYISIFPENTIQTRSRQGMKKKTKGELYLRHWDINGKKLSKQNFSYQNNIYSIKSILNIEGTSL